jgi:hydroxymethylglutaryl-CoA reductase
MSDKGLISGFSKKSKEDKIAWLLNSYSNNPSNCLQILKSFDIQDENIQNIVDGFSENTITNFIIPLGIAPNVVINDKVYSVPMAIEESSVVAAAAAGAKFWSKRGGFHTNVIGTEKIGQVHFYFYGDHSILYDNIESLQVILRQDSKHLTSNMQKRGGGIMDIELKSFSDLELNYFQLFVTFDTCDSMGANFINSVLESFAQTLKNYFSTFDDAKLDVIMSILSNYTPNCIVRAEVKCPIDELGIINGMKPEVFADRFNKAMNIARIDTYRATTHNKGIFNGIDAVIIATGNDFRSVEACGHTYACKDGKYRSLSHCSIDNGIFHFWMEVPFAIGTVGGLTKLHPIAKLSLELLGNPNAEMLMQIVASIGLAQNFAAIRSLVTTGIQEGHMKMHLTNILNHLAVEQDEMDSAYDHFKDKPITFTGVRTFIESRRKQVN